MSHPVGGGDLACPTCSTPVDEADLCAHRDPLCTVCCLGGEHDWWTPPPWEDVA